MKITKFWARGYRSLRDVTLEGLGDFNVFYGPNGSGKSNLLDAMRALFDLVGVLPEMGHVVVLDPKGERASGAAKAAGERMRDQRVLVPRDIRIGESTRHVVLGATCEAVREDQASDGDLTIGASSFHRVSVDLGVDWTLDAAPRLVLRELTFDDTRADQLQPSSAEGDRYFELMAFLKRFSKAAFSLVDADRAPHGETTREETTTSLPPEVTDPVAWYLRQRRLKHALYTASTSGDRQARDRLKAFRALLEGPPLHRPAFDTVHDPRTGEVDIREPLGNSDVSLDLAGLGVAQIYAVLAGIVLSGSRAVGIEEPEAHLHALSSGRDLRTLLRRVVDEKIVRQLFIATHSNLFDLDPTGYWDVSIDDNTRETRVVRKPLYEIDVRHLYEPGPAKHQLEETLRLYGDEVVFRASDGRELKASDMLEALQNDTNVAVAFLQTMHAAAMQVTGLRARRNGGPKPEAAE